MPHLMHILKADSIIKTFGLNRVLSDVYLQCRTGDIIGLLGRNGSGKSTLLKILFGTTPADHSYISIDEQVYREPYRHVGQIGYLAQDSFLPGHLKVSKIIELYLGTPKIDLFINDPVMATVINNKVSGLSGGELRYLEIMLLLHSDVKFVLLDEPFNGVAPVVIDSLKPMIRQHAQTKGIILTDHDYNNVLDVANQYYLLTNGCMKRVETREELVQWGYLTERSIQ